LRVGDATVAKTRLKKTLTDRTEAAIRQVIAGKRGGMRSAFLFAGPAVIASIAYIDPGNFATNIQAGSHFGYLLLWVVVMANLIAMLFQALSAKLASSPAATSPRCAATASRPLCATPCGA
jgi:manganese transport protein